MEPREPCVILGTMELTDIFLALEREGFEELIKGISIGGLRTYQVYEPLKIHAGLHKLNRERLRKSVPRLWERIEGANQDLAHNLAQGILVSNLPMVVDVLNFLEIPHDGNGFFDKEGSVKEQLTEGWQKRVLDHFGAKHPKPLLLLYINHLDWELGKPAAPFLG